MAHQARTTTRQALLEQIVVADRIAQQAQHLSDEVRWIERSLPEEPRVSDPSLRNGSLNEK